MPEVGTRVATNFVVLDQEDKIVPANAVGNVVGHIGDLEIVSMDHGQTSTGTNRVVTWAARAFRPVRVAHPGKPRRSRPRRVEE